jgi:hypothetical protein
MFHPSVFVFAKKLGYEGKMSGSKDNQNHLIHGGAAAVKAIQTGAPFTGLVRDAELEVKNELNQLDGLSKTVESDATRLETAARLYYGAFSKAVEDGDIDRATSYVKMFAWLETAALRGWQAVKENRGKHDNSIDVVLKAVKEGHNDQNQD